MSSRSRFIRKYSDWNDVNKPHPNSLARPWHKINAQSLPCTSMQTILSTAHLTHGYPRAQGILGRQNSNPTNVIFRYQVRNEPQATPPSSRGGAVYAQWGWMTNGDHDKREDWGSLTLHRRTPPGRLLYPPPGFASPWEFVFAGAFLPWDGDLAGGPEGTFIRSLNPPYTW